MKMAVIANRCLNRSIRKFNNVQGVSLRALGLLFLIIVTVEGNGCNIRGELEVLRDYDLPSQPIQGPICGTSSCCGSAENKLRIISRLEVENFFKESVSQVSSLLETRSRRLEELFREMMSRSKKELHSMFERTYGMIYLQNSNVFMDFFTELDRYYSHGGVSLTETMDHFFSILYQRMFKVINAQYYFDEEYLTCVAKDIVKLKPFGDIPIKLAILLRRSFVATRIFHKALGKGALVAEKMLKLNISYECGEEVTMMQYCSYCTGQKQFAPCANYCTDTIKTCLGVLAELNENWNGYIDGLDKVADKLLGPFNIEMVVEPINVKISEAIMNFQESGAEVSQKVFLECGAPKLSGDRRRKRRAASNGNVKEVKFQPLKFNKGKKKHKKTNEYDRQSLMEKRITEVKQKIKETRNFWTHLPYQYCNNISTAAPSEFENCWNGTAPPALSTFNFTPTKSTKPTIVLEQIYTLQVLISKLQSAYQGQDDELSDDDDDTDEGEAVGASGSGSGSGESDGDLDVEMEESATTTTTTTTSTTSATTEVVIRNYDGPKVITASGSSLTKALIHYILPIVMVWFGGAVSEVL